MRAAPIEIKWNDDLSIYASEPFLKAVSDEYGWLGGFEDSPNPICALPYTIIRKATFRLVRFRVETIPLINSFTINDERGFLNDAVRYFRSINADMIIPATTNTIFRTYPDQAIAAPYGSYIIDLNKSIDSIFGNFSSSHRRKVRLAEKQGIEIKCGLEHTDAAYNLVQSTFKRSNMGFMKLKEFRKYVESIKNNIRVLVACLDDEVQGAIVIPFSKYCAYYVYGGSIPKPATGAMNLLHWEAMKYFRKDSVRRYDFVGSRINPPQGSKQDGIATFKQRFGGKLSQGYLWKMPLNKFSYKIYALAVKALRGGDIIDQEMRIAPL